MNTECLNCENSNAYFDGARFVCPDCGYEWDFDGLPNEFDDDIDDELEDDF